MPKLYKAEVAVDVVICVLDDQEPSDYVLREAASREVTENGAHIMGVESVNEIDDVRNLPYAWDVGCLPWCIEGGRIVKNKDRTIKNFLEEIGKQEK